MGVINGKIGVLKQKRLGVAKGLQTPNGGNQLINLKVKASLKTENPKNLKETVKSRNTDVAEIIKQCEATREINQVEYEQIASKRKSKEIILPVFRRSESMRHIQIQTKTPQSLSTTYGQDNKSTESISNHFGNKEILRLLKRNKGNLNACLVFIAKGSNASKQYKKSKRSKSKRSSKRCLIRKKSSVKKMLLMVQSSKIAPYKTFMNGKKRI